MVANSYYFLSRFDSLFRLYVAESTVVTFQAGVCQALVAIGVALHFIDGANIHAANPVVIRVASRFAIEASALTHEGLSGRCNLHAI